MPLSRLSKRKEHFFFYIINLLIAKMKFATLYQKRVRISFFIVLNMQLNDINFLIAKMKFATIYQKRVRISFFIVLNMQLNDIQCFRKSPK